MICYTIDPVPRADLAAAMDLFQPLTAVGVVAQASGAPGEFAKAIASHCGSEASAGCHSGLWTS